MFVFIPIDKFCFQPYSEKSLFPLYCDEDIQGTESKWQMRAPFVLNKTFISCTSRLHEHWGRGIKRMQELEDEKKAVQALDQAPGVQ